MENFRYTDGLCTTALMAGEEASSDRPPTVGNPLNSPCLLLFSTENNLSYFGFLLGKKMKKGRVGLLWPLEPRRAANAPPCLFGTKN